MGARVDARTGRQAEDGGGGQVEERPGADRRSVERILTSDEDAGFGFAPAKINLFLHVGPRTADGYHPICSLMTFANVGDVLRPDPTAGDSLIIEGPFAAGLSAGADNLVLRARDLALRPTKASPIGLHLVKNLPLASGIGGGSADAAAAFRLTALRTGVNPTDPTILAAAAALGSDIPACLTSKPVLATGRGEILQSPPTFPRLHAVLVNPGVDSPTAAAYRAYDAAPSMEGADCPWPGAALRTAGETAAFLARCRNDLEAPVVRRIPAVGRALALLRGQADTLLARMSGSGATCFAVVADVEAAQRLETRVAGLEPRWWVRRVILDGAP